MNAPLVSLRNVSAGYDGREALSGVSFDIHEGDFVGITGPNGGGKTTLVKVLMGLLPHSGTVEYADGLTSGGVRRIGYLPQQSVFDRSFPICVIDVVVSGLQVEKGFSRRYTRMDFAQARKLLETIGISDIERRPIGEISGGQMQRALLCRALIASPRLLILDEPATWVDNRFEGELYTLLRRLNEGNEGNEGNGKPGGGNGKSKGSAASPLPSHKMAIVMVSHDTAAISAVAKSVVHVDGTLERVSR